MYFSENRLQLCHSTISVSFPRQQLSLLNNSEDSHLQFHKLFIFPIREAPKIRFLGILPKWVTPVPNPLFRNNS